MSSRTVEIIRADSAAQIKQFLQFPYDLYIGDPSWRAPLRLERKENLSAEKNPKAKVLSRQFFLARCGEEIVGRIGAFINPAHQSLHKDEAGHFGFWDCVGDAGVGAALLEAAEDWLRSRNAKKIIGPTSHTTNEESGLLIDGFDTPPVLMMPYGRAYYQGMIEEAGYDKAIDMYAYMADLSAGYPRPKTTTMMVRLAEKDPAITFRPINLKALKEEVNIIMDIFNDAWSENWGFVPFSDADIEQLATEMKPLLISETFIIGEIGGKPAAYIGMLPDLNAAVDGLNGRLVPFGWAKLIYRLKIKGVKTSRIPLMGIRKEYQNTRQGLAVVAKLCEDVFAAGRKKGFTHCELSWILETNKSMIRICEQASAKRYKTYRMYEKAL